MKYLNHYIARNVMAATGLVLLVLVGIEIFMLFFSEMTLIGKGSYHVFKAMLVVFMELPFQLYQLFPMAGFLGCLVGLSRLSASSELVVMRASGISPIDILVSVSKAAFLMLLVMTFLGEVISPKLKSSAEAIKAVALEKNKKYVQPGGIWLRDRSSFINIKHVQSVDEAAEVSIFGLQKSKINTIRFAHQVKKIKNEWQLFDIRQTEFEKKAVSTRFLPEEMLTIHFDPVALSLGQLGVDQLSIKGLYDSVRSRKEAKLDTDLYRFAFWQRLLQPFLTLVMVAFGVPFIFSLPRNQSMGFRILMGIMVGFVFYTLNQFLGPVAVVYQVSPWVAASVPLLVFLMAYGILVRYFK